MIDEYIKIAPVYEKLLGKILYKIRCEVVNLCKKYQLNSLLDIGCGTGGQGAMLLKHGLDFTGIDNSEAMLNQARINLPKNAMLYHLPASNFAEIVMADKKNIDVSLTSLIIHELPHELRLQILNEAKKCAKYLILVEYVLPERNLAIPASLLVHIVERLAGKRHYKCYGDFMRRGAIEGYIYEEKLTTIESKTMLGGALRIALTKW